VKLNNKMNVDDYFSNENNEKIIIDVESELDKISKSNIENNKETKYNKGWKLEILKINNIMFNFVLYDMSGQFIESKMFNIRIEEDLDKMREYLSLFENDPKQNLERMKLIESETPIQQPDYDMIERSYKHNY
jgi:hypothetical protein